MIIGTFRLNFCYAYTEDTEIFRMCSLWPRFTAMCVKGKVFLKISIRNTLVSAYHVSNTIMGISSDREKEKTNIIL